MRALLVANDGFSAGHVVRTIAVARGLARRGRDRGISVQVVLATTSEADALLADDAVAVVRLPAPVAARRAGLSDQDRRRLVRGALDGIVSSFAPDLFVVDTFPSGPHGEVAGLAVGSAKRALVRRSVPRSRAKDSVLCDGLADYDLAIVAADPFTHGAELPASLRCVMVPPITIGEAGDAKTRAEARAELGLPADRRVVLVASGGGGDVEASERAASIARSLGRVAPDVVTLVAAGPLRSPGMERRSSDRASGSRVIRVAPLQPLLAALDGAFSPAGYNTAHELAKAGVPAALFAEPRPFDDQAARAARFAEAALAYELKTFDDAAIARARSWMDASSARAPRVVEPGGADRAADALLDLVTGALDA